MPDGAAISDEGPRTYADLRRAVEAVFLRSQREVDEAQIMVYWRTGDLIHRHVALKEGCADYGLEVVARLAADFEASRSVMYRCLQFRRAYEIVAARRQLLWAHYRVLMLITDHARRDALELTADREGWNTRQLEARVRPLLLAQQEEPAAAAGGTRTVAKLLVPRRGAVGVHRLAPGAEGLAVDLGFTSFFELTPEQAKGAQQGDLVRLDAAGRLTSAEEATPGDLYTYRADCLRVVDGDTIWFRVHLRARHWLKEKVRLRGLDCPEIDTTEGRAAKRFVEALLARAEAVTISTTKPDKYDRYLADVFMRPKPGTPAADGADAGEIFLNNALLENGHARRKDDWSVDDWEDDGSGVPG